MMKFMKGTWFEFQHHNLKEGVYWNPECRNFDCSQWREKVREIRQTGMEYIVLLASSLNFQAYFDTDIFPKAEMNCANPLETLLSEADECGMKVFMSAGFYGDWTQTLLNMTDPAITRTGLKAMNQLTESFGHHRSFYGWYLPDETCINGYFSRDFINYINTYAKEARKLNMNSKVLIAPYGTRLVKADDTFTGQLESLDVDFIAYQDEVGVRKTKVEESAAFFEKLKRAHDKAGRSALWADVEIFEFEGEVYRSALLPAEISRVKRQLEAVSPYVENILVYQYQGMMNKPGSKAFAGHASSERLYVDYMDWMKQHAGES